MNMKITSTGLLLTITKYTYELTKYLYAVDGSIETTFIPFIGPFPQQQFRSIWSDNAVKTWPSSMILPFDHVVASFVACWNDPGGIGDGGGAKEFWFVA